jgi:hypothetical protein
MVKSIATFLITSVLCASVVAQEQQARDYARAAAIAASKAQGSKQQVILEEPARSYFEWGAIMNDKAEVVSVRKGSVAAAMTLQVGDVIQHINQQPVDPQNLDKALTTLASLEHNQAFSVGVLRQKQALELNGVARATVIPGWRLEVNNTLEEGSHTGLMTTKSNDKACGRISVFFTPPVTADLYPAFINTIDGDNVRIKNPSFKLALNKYQIGIHELIDEPSLRRGGGSAPEKVLELTIEPNKTYHIAAKFIRDKRYQRFNDGYWEPVVWKVTDQTCQLD